MKAAVIIYADSPHLGQSVGELDILLSDLETRLDSLEMWVLCQQPVPTSLPRLHVPLHSLLFLTIDSPAVPEVMLHRLVALQEDRAMDLLLFCGDALGQELCTRLAFRLGGVSAVNVEHCVLAGSTIDIVRRVYGSNLVAKIGLDGQLYCLSAARQPARPAPVEPVSDAVVVECRSPKPELGWLRQWHVQPENSEAGLAGAEIVLALGSGVQNREELTQLQEVAEALGAEIGVSRPVAMNGWLDMSRLIGASGQLLSPRLCIAAGVSGSAVFSCGIEGSQFVVAINTDSEAAIFCCADVGIVDDLIAVLTELATIVRKSHEGN